MGDGVRLPQAGSGGGPTAPAGQHTWETPTGEKTATTTPQRRNSNTRHAQLELLVQKGQAREHNGQQQRSGPSGSGIGAVVKSGSKRGVNLPRLLLYA